MLVANLSSTSATGETELPRLVVVGRAAHLLGISVRHLRTLAAHGQLRLLQLGRLTLVRRSEIDHSVAKGVGRASHENILAVIDNLDRARACAYTPGESFDPELSAVLEILDEAKRQVGEVLSRSTR